MNLTSFTPEDFNVKVYRTKPYMTIRSTGRFSFTQEAAIILGLEKKGQTAILYQAEEPHTSIWLLELVEKGGWPFTGKLNGASCIGFHCKALKESIFESFEKNQDEKMTFFLYTEPVTIEGKKLWVLFPEESELNAFLDDLGQLPEVSGHNGKPKNGRKRKQENAFEGGIS